MNNIKYLDKGDKQMLKKQLIGAWLLKEWYLEKKDHSYIYPYGKDALGYLFYINDHQMSVHLMRKKPPVLKSTNPLQVLSNEAKQIVESSASYCGTYKITENYIEHHIEICSFPKWVGSIQKRYFIVKENMLFLNHTLEYENSEIDSILVWKKLTNLKQ